MLLEDMMLASYPPTRLLQDDGGSFTNLHHSEEAYIYEEYNKKLFF